ncbi:MAG: TadE/TadG family type IV pilus assembly protein [Hydrogenophaga sp.]|uniref:TadE/TadG family type IV pilus assembly protein n=1 Tax=Hydrogenophaga sp. TaxID=1904254 RepID=UPI002AB8F398|nr:TadE/TadG family type IV pilus assembly protein [Hydrogenophaga sp.]MDZ4102000.1 TadE/TadG family type IV pilus assembly protein [Hydrogenophaga sp.]
MHQKAFRYRIARSQRGVVAILLGLSLTVLIGFAGLAIDLGRFFIIKTELQNGMDACALAASSQLRPGQNNATALDRAIAYGRVFTTGGVSQNPLEGNIAAIQNRIAFQEQVVNVQAENITFSTSLAGPYLSKASSDANTAAFVQCSVPLNNIPVFFMRVLNPLLTTQTVSARAVATLAPSSSSCAIPVAACKVPGTTAATNFGLSVGQWLAPPAGPGSPYGTGNFGWIDFTPPGGGASELADLLTGPGQCNTGIGTEVDEPGSLASLETAWNSRFGVYRNGTGNPQVGTAPPDVTGYGYTAANWGPASNAYAGSSAGSINYRTAAAAYTRYQVDPPNPFSRITDTQHQSLGRNRRVVVAPVVDCTIWNTGTGRPALEGFACVLMLNPMLGSSPVPTMEFLGLSTSPGSPCATNGAPGTFGPLVPQLVQ